MELITANLVSVFMNSPASNMHVPGFMNPLRNYITLVMYHRNINFS